MDWMMTQAHPTGNAIQRPCTQQRANGGPDDRAGQTQRAAGRGEACEWQNHFGRDGREHRFEGDGQSHADATDGFHQGDEPFSDGADQAAFGRGADGCGVSRECSGKLHRKTHRGHCLKVFRESKA